MRTCTSIITVCAIFVAWSAARAASVMEVIRASDVNSLRFDINSKRTGCGLLPVAWTEDPIVAGSTTIKASHITELRGSFNGLMIQSSTSGSGNVQFTDPTLSVNITTIKAAHLNEVVEIKNAATCVAVPPPPPPPPLPPPVLCSIASSDASMEISDGNMNMTATLMGGNQIKLTNPGTLLSPILSFTGCGAITGTGSLTGTIWVGNGNKIDLYEATGSGSNLFEFADPPALAIYVGSLIFSGTPGITITGKIPIYADGGSEFLTFSNDRITAEGWGALIFSGSASP